MTGKTQQDIIYDLVQEVRVDQKEMHKNLIEHKVVFQEHLRQDEKLYEELYDMKNNLSEINKILGKNTESLIQHIEGVNTLKALHVQNAERIARLEEPDKVKNYLRNKVIMYSGVIAAIAGAAAAIIKIFG